MALSPWQPQWTGTWSTQSLSTLSLYSDTSSALHNCQQPVHLWNQIPEIITQSTDDNEPKDHFQYFSYTRQLWTWWGPWSVIPSPHSCLSVSSLACLQMCGQVLDCEKITHSDDNWQQSPFSKAHVNIISACNPPHILCLTIRSASFVLHSQSSLIQLLEWPSSGDTWHTCTLFRTV